MSIPEATQLVLQTGAMTRGGDVFVLDMGEPVKIINLARGLIKFCGLEEPNDIEIEFTGHRSVEKLYEELIFNKEEETLQTAHSLVRVVKRGYEKGSQADTNLEKLPASKKSLNNIKSQIRKVINEYNYNYN